jgi:hypothetical protein
MNYYVALRRNMEAKTINSQQIWRSPDGKRTIWDVELQVTNGELYHIKTYSPDIAKLGFKGHIKSYVNRFGERFVRQIEAPRKKATSYSRDDNAIRAQWAIGQAINLASVKMDKEGITLPVIEDYAKQLYATVSRVKGETLSPKEAAQAEEHIRAFTQATV